MQKLTIHPWTTIVASPPPPPPPNTSSFPYSLEALQIEDCGTWSRKLRPRYRVKFRHVGSKEFHPRPREFSAEWVPFPLARQPHNPYVYRSPKSPSPKKLWPRTGCCTNQIGDSFGATDEVIGINSEKDDLDPQWEWWVGLELVPNVQLAALAQNICRNGRKYRSDEGIREITAAIVWRGEPPRDPAGNAHGCFVGPGHLAMMRQRNCGDYIRVDFVIDEAQGQGKRKSMLRALTKLSKKASSHCNR
ncbi:hypothetical protein ANO14919_068490 [Xylariales sp. No.14919]|nr:hypothetical protein ANO14919_068490 [Xylariales sp. No.14919]